jgi:CHAD domain-containing protein
MAGNSQKSNNHGDTHLRKLTDTLKESLAKCADNPDVSAVHDTRTGTRRIEAALEAMLRDAGMDAGANDAGANNDLAKLVRAWERLLKRIRRAAAPVRDLDVQRKLLKKLVPVVEAKIKTPIEEPESGMAGQVARLDDALKDERDDRAAALKKNAAKWAAKLDASFEEVAGADRGSARKQKTDAATAALNAFARLATQMRQLDAGNLHEFRKGVKKARYMAEADDADERAQAVARALRKIQDEIGDWHDWLMLAEEAHQYLDKDGAPLTAEIERMRDAYFEMAIKMEQKMRGRLIGEGLAVPSRPARPRPSAAAPVASRPSRPVATQSREIRRTA